MNFERAMAIVFELEGGYVNDPADSGGATKFGISATAYPNVDIKNLTREDAIALYRRDYWDKCRCVELPDAVRLAVFDSAVNQGTMTAIRILQKAVNVKADGIIGSITLAAAHNTPALADEFLARRLYAYMLIPQSVRFGLGWSRRLIHIARESFAKESRPHE